ncbi:Uncharacterised protein [Chlamydia trachomatis]|nr:Uncharacterised protein [Chlamydia trachomatis]
MNQVISSSNNSDVKYTDPTKLYKFNDAFSRLYFGYSLAEIAQGGAKVVEPPNFQPNPIPYPEIIPPTNV